MHFSNRKKMPDTNVVSGTRVSGSRRTFIKTASLALAGMGLMGGKRSVTGLTETTETTVETVPKTVSSKTENTLRVIAYNIYHATGWPIEKSATAREKLQMPRRIAQELLLYDPDIVTFSEAPSEVLVREIAALMNMAYCFLPSAGNWPGAILTRHRIVGFQNVPVTEGQREQDLFTRHWGKATIRLASGKDVIVHSAHLYPHDRPENNAIRAREISGMLRSMQRSMDNDSNMLIMADLNHRPDMAGYQRWMETGWVDTFSGVDEQAGYTFRADEPYQRIDYVLARGPLSRHILEGRPLFEGAFRTNPDDANSFALSDHLPYMAVFGI